MRRLRLGRIVGSLVGGALIFLGVFARQTPTGRASEPSWAIAGAVLIGSVLIASALDRRPPPPPRPKPPHPLD